MTDEDGLRRSGVFISKIPSIRNSGIVRENNKEKTRTGRYRFEQEGDNVLKKSAGYHQFHAVREAVIVSRQPDGTQTAESRAAYGREGDAEIAQGQGNLAYARLREKYLHSY